MIPKMTGTTFTELARQIGTRDTAVRIGENTTAERDGESIAVRYHGHRIATFSPVGVILTDAGYRTATTKTRLNLFAPAGVAIFQQAHEWFVSVRGTVYPWGGEELFATA